MGGVKGGLQLVEKNPQLLGVILHLEEEVEKGINIVIIWFFVAVVNSKVEKIEFVSSSLQKQKKGGIYYDTFTKKKSFCSKSFIKKNK